jgi:predicted deacylase
VSRKEANVPMGSDADVNLDLVLGISDPLPSETRAAGYVRIPYSSNASAYGFVPLPFAVLGADEGIQILVLAGSHGDETESQVALVKLLGNLDPRAMKGRIVALPMANEPAARVGARNSSIDGLNLNRVYPGNMFGSPTTVIADYIERQLMSESEVVLDLHSSSDSFNYLPCAAIIFHPDKEERIRRLSLALAFGAPNVLVMHSYEDRNSSGAATRAGAVRFATELSGQDAVRMTIEGILNLLRWSGILPRNTKKAPAKSSLPNIKVIHPESHYVYALYDGVLEPRVRLGDMVEKGQVVSLIHDPSRPFRPTREIKATTSGQVVCLRPFGRISTGDFVLHLGEDPDVNLSDDIAEAVKSNWLRELSLGPRKGRRPRRR